jgi:hypothetical protein
MMLLHLRLVAQDVIVIVTVTVTAAIVVATSPPTAVATVAAKTAVSVIGTDAVMLMVVPVEKRRTVTANVTLNPASLCVATLTRVKRPDDETVETGMMGHQRRALFLVPMPTPTMKVKAAFALLLQREHHRPHHLHLRHLHCPLTTTHVAGALVETVGIDLTTVTGNASAEVTVAVTAITERVAAQAIASVDALTQKRMPVVMDLSVAHARATTISVPVVGSECH